MGAFLVIYCPRPDRFRGRRGIPPHTVAGPRFKKCRRPSTRHLLLGKPVQWLEPNNSTSSARSSYQSPFPTRLLEWEGVLQNLKRDAMRGEALPGNTLSRVFFQESNTGALPTCHDCAPTMQCHE